MSIQFCKNDVNAFYVHHKHFQTARVDASDNIHVWSFRFSVSYLDYWVVRYKLCSSSILMHSLVLCFLYGRPVLRVLVIVHILKFYFSDCQINCVKSTLFSIILVWLLLKDVKFVHYEILVPGPSSDREHADRAGGGGRWP